MNRKEFMIRLEQLLTDISEEERADALQYYEDYFDDAGAENEESVIQELESPEKVAAIIRTDLKDVSRESGEYTEWGYTDERFTERETPAMRGEHTKEGDRYSYHQGASQGGGAYGYGQNSGTQEYAIPPKTNRLLKVILIALIVLIVCPIAVPVAFAILATVFALIAASFAVFASFVIAAVAVAASGLLLIVLGLVKLIVIFPSAILTIGVGMLLFVAGLVATVATVKLCMVMYPAMCRIIVQICRWPFHRRKVVA